LVDLKRIQRRHEAVGELKDDLAKRQDVRQRLKATYDIERLIGRVSSGNANGRDMVSLRATLEMVPGLKAALEGSKCELLRIIQKRLDPCQDLCELLSRALVDEPPTGVKEGDIFREGYHPELDELISLGRDGKDWLLEYETKERSRTGIQSLKVKFTSVFGYFIEITKANFHLIPADYIRKQTLANAERFFTEDLKEYEEKVLHAQDRRVALEYKLFEDLREQVAGQLSRLHQSAYLLSTLDVLGGLAEIAARHGYCRPEMTEDDTLDILDGRHPVVEQSLPSDERFVANSVRLDCADNQLLLITGPNMAGKSTIIRQVALISLLAQMGSFVPASSARLSIVDRIFSRVGASDNLAKGQSTFMVEMTETAHILKSATRRSLIILDEIGRGTSTYDGLSIAWAVAEFIHDEIGAKTLFATHYHELTILAEQLRGVQNFNIACKEWKDDVIFLRKLVPGPANRSYGIQVGRLAGLPSPVVERAKELLANLERTSHGFIEQPSHGSAAVEVAGKAKANAPAPALSPKLVAALSGQMPALPAAPAMPPEVEQVLGEVKKMELSTLTPLEALNLVYKLQKRLLA
jgi:DNA mismatch repair protein MutS